MRQLFLDKGILAIKEVCEPELDDHSILVSVHYSFIGSGSGLVNLIQANQNLFYDIPNKVKKVIEIVTHRGFDYTAKIIKDRLKGKVFALGNSCSGVVVAVGKEVKKFRVGDYVACAGPGFANHADIVCIPQEFVMHVKESMLKEASLVGIGSIAAQVICRANLKLGETICVFGLETLGQVILQLAKVSGCNVIGIDINNEYLAYATNTGIKYTFNSSTDNLKQSIDLLTSFKGVDCVIITPDCVIDNVSQDSLKIIRKGGRIVVVGDSDIKIKKNIINLKDVDILFTLSCNTSNYDESFKHEMKEYIRLFVNLLENKQIDIKNLLKDEFTLDNISQAVEKIQQGNLGAVLNYTSNKEKTFLHKEIKNDVTFIPAFKDKLKIGILGANKFTRFNILPIISKLNSVSIDTILDRDITNSLNAARYFPGAVALSGNAKLFNENGCNTILVGPCADINADELISILERGKAVFVSKPLAMNLEDFKHLDSFFKIKKNIAFCIGYHRSFSPFIQKIKKVVSNRQSPLIINYRVNAGFIPRDQMLSLEWKSGRIISEASHIFDLFCHLTDARPVSVSVESLKQLNNDTFPTDNFIANINFSDGSICSLLFTSLGHLDLSKERMEIFFDSKSIVMEDYITLTGYGLSPSFDEKVRIQDCGYERLITSFLDGIRKDNIELPINLERLKLGLYTTLIVDELACKGGGEKLI